MQTAQALRGCGACLPLRAGACTAFYECSAIGAFNDAGGACCLGGQFSDTRQFSFNSLPTKSGVGSAKRACMHWMFQTIWQP